MLVKTTTHYCKLTVMRPKDAIRCLATAMKTWRHASTIQRQHCGLPELKIQLLGNFALKPYKMRPVRTLFKPPKARA